MPWMGATSSYSIGQLSRVAGVATSTIRFYERRGLLTPDARTRANYRSYSARAAERLAFIRAAQGSGFNLKDIEEMLALSYSDERPCAEVARLIDRRLAEVKQRLGELKRVARALSAARESCCKGGRDWCVEVERLKAGRGRNGAPGRRHAGA